VVVVSLVRLDCRLTTFRPQYVQQRCIDLYRWRWSKVSLRLQASTFSKTYSVSFSEPWFMEKPVSFSSSLSYSKQF
jgi:hypothetical protein